LVVTMMLTELTITLLEKPKCERARKYRQYPKHTGQTKISKRVAEADRKLECVQTKRVT